MTGLRVAFSSPEAVVMWLLALSPELRPRTLLATGAAFKITWRPWTPTGWLRTRRCGTSEPGRPTSCRQDGFWCRQMTRPMASKFKAYGAIGGFAHDASTRCRPGCRCDRLFPSHPRERGSDAREPHGRDVLLDGPIDSAAIRGGSRSRRATASLRNFKRVGGSRSCIPCLHGCQRRPALRQAVGIEPAILSIARGSALASVWSGRKQAERSVRRLTDRREQSR